MWSYSHMVRSYLHIYWDYNYILYILHHRHSDMNLTDLHRYHVIHIGLLGSGQRYLQKKLKNWFLSSQWKWKHILVIDIDVSSMSMVLILWFITWEWLSLWIVAKLLWYQKYEITVYVIMSWSADIIEGLRSFPQSKYNSINYQRNLW